MLEMHTVEQKEGDMAKKKVGVEQQQARGPSEGCYGRLKTLLIGLVGVAIVITIALQQPREKVEAGTTVPAAAVSLPTRAATNTATTRLTRTRSATETPAATRTATSAASEAPAQPVGVVPATATLTRTRTATVTATATATRPATQTATPTLSLTPGIVVTVIQDTYYARGSANLRACPGTHCEVAGQTVPGTPLTVTGATPGEAVSAANAIWYRVEWQGGVAYIYSELVSTNPPPTQGAPAAPPGQAQYPRPRSCATAVAYGLGAAEIAQRWPHLDRDKDGVACYGD